MLFTTLVHSFALFATTGLAGYVLEDDYFANNFFDQFSFWDSADPTNGFVAYQNRANAQSMGLIKSSATNAQMLVDSTNNSPNGRASVRLTSNKSYSSGLVVVDVEHMPGGTCGTWPAFWMVGPNWPIGGEIDIIEGVNDQTFNDMTLHTGPGCSVNSLGGFTGKMTSTTCTSSGGNNLGCGISASDANTYGAGFNSNNGGVYAMEWTGDAISVWFFPRSSVPGDVLGNSPNPSGWGSPVAHFSGQCNFGSSFVQQQLVFDTTFCGDWAGNAWSSSSCAQKANTCNAFVQNNPSAFADAYWSINALKVYQNGGSAPAASSTPIATQTTPAIVTQPTAQPTSNSPPASPTETGTAFAPWIGGDGTVEGGAEPSSVAPSAATGGFAWTTEPNGDVGFAPQRRNENDRIKERLARHLRLHKRHGGRF